MNRAGHPLENLSECQGKVVVDFMHSWHTVTYIRHALNWISSFTLTDNKEQLFPPPKKSNFKKLPTIIIKNKSEGRFRLGTWDL